jgi:hypothetical protein
LAENIEVFMSGDLLKAVAEDLAKDAGFDMPEKDLDSAPAWNSYKDKVAPYAELLANCVHTVQTDAILAHTSQLVDAVYEKTHDEKLVKDAAESFKKLLDALGVPVRKK